MKVRLTFKCPDVLDQATLSFAESLDDDDVNYEEVVLNQRDGLKEMLRKWVKFDECVTIEFDTDSGTVEVLPAER